MKFKITTLTILIATFFVMAFVIKPEDNNPAAGYDFLKKRLENTKTYTIEVFEVMPEDDYGYKPNEDVRSFAAQAFHIAYTVEWFMPNLKGAPIKWEPGDEDRLGKKELITYANEQFDKLNAFINEADESPELTDKIIDFLNHNAHHRGQMITYLRMKGIKPPDYR